MASYRIDYIIDGNEEDEREMYINAWDSDEAEDIFFETIYPRDAEIIRIEPDYYEL